MERGREKAERRSLKWALFEDLQGMGIDIPIQYILNCSKEDFYEMIYRYEKILTTDTNKDRERRKLWQTIV